MTSNVRVTSSGPAGFNTPACRCAGNDSSLTIPFTMLIKESDSYRALYGCYHTRAYAILTLRYDGFYRDNKYRRYSQRYLQGV